MGISNATIVDYFQEQFRYNPDGLKIDRSAPRTNLFANAGTPAGVPGAAGSAAASGSSEGFTIEPDSGTTGASFPGASFPGASGFPGGAGAPGTAGGPGGTVDPKQFKKLTRFIIQFAYKPTPPEERNKPEGEAATEEKPAEEKPAAE